MLTQILASLSEVKTVSEAELLDRVKLIIKIYLVIAPERNIAAADTRLEIGLLSPE